MISNCFSSSSLDQLMFAAHGVVEAGIDVDRDGVVLTETASVAVDVLGFFLPV